MLCFCLAYSAQLFFAGLALGFELRCGRCGCSADVFLFCSTLAAVLERGWVCAEGVWRPDLVFAWLWWEGRRGMGGD